MKRRVVHFKKSPYDIYIGRPSIWGNPFRTGADGTKSEVISKYKEWVKTQPHLMDLLPSLEGKVLGCWCKPEACHGDALIELVDEMKFEKLLRFAS